MRRPLRRRALMRRELVAASLPSVRLDLIAPAGGRWVGAADLRGDGMPAS